MTPRVLSVTCDLCHRSVAVIDETGTVTAASAGRVTDAGPDRWRVECRLGRHRHAQARVWTREKARTVYGRFRPTRQLFSGAAGAAVVVAAGGRSEVAMSEVRSR